MIALCKTILPNQPACFDSSSSKFNLQGHMLSTAAVVLRAGTGNVLQNSKLKNYDNSKLLQIVRL
jgi:hypothetical protein